MIVPARPPFRWSLRTRTLELGPRTLLMGIVNVTPDSFFDGDAHMTTRMALDRGLRLLDQGADLLDLGGESTRPNAEPVSPAEEQDRVLPVLRALLAVRRSAIVSVDTYHASTARLALDAGAEIVNDVSGLLWDDAMAALLAEARCGAVLMHTRGAPRSWPTLAALPHAEILPLVTCGLTHTLHLARDAGITRERIVLDPGFGFGKRDDENFVLLSHLYDLRELGSPLLAGISNKRFLTAHRIQPTGEQRLHATLAAHTAAILAGTHILRVHEITAARAAADAADSILAACPTLARLP